MDILVLSVATGGCVGVLKITPEESAIYDPITSRKMFILAGTLYDEELVLPQKTTEERMGYVPKDGAIVYDTTVQRIFVGDGETSGGVVPFTELHAAKVEVDSLVSGQIVVSNCEPVPVTLKTSGGKIYQLEKESLTQSGGSWCIDPAPYMAYANESSFAGPWTVYLAGGGAPGRKGDKGENGSLTIPIEEYSSDSAYAALTCITYNGGGYQVLSATSAGENPDNAASKFICFARPSDIPDFQPIISGGSAIVPQVNRAFQVPLSSGMVISVDSSGLSSSVCVTQELWLDMPATPVSFSLPGFTWVDGSAPDFTSSSTRYALTVRWDGSAFLANLAYSRSLA